MMGETEGYMSRCRACHYGHHNSCSDGRCDCDECWQPPTVCRACNRSTTGRCWRHDTITVRTG